MTAGTRILVDGKRASALPEGDRGLAYGDGLFETLRVHRGDLPWWPAHWQRLALGAGRLGIPLPDEAKSRAEARDLVAANTAGVLKLILTRGAGGRGYAPPEQPRPTLVLSCHPLPPAAPAGGLQLRWCDTRLAIQPSLAGIKHCNRLEQVLARAEWSDPAIHEGLMRDSDGQVVCATAANVFARIGGRWLTPRVDRCGVAGVARAWLLERVEGAAEARLGAEDITAAEALFLCNAVRGILPVSVLGEQRWQDPTAVDAIRRQLADAVPAFAMES